MYIFISEKNDISEALQGAFLGNRVVANNKIHKVGKMDNGEDVIILTAQGHILSMKNAWELKGVTKEEHYKEWNEKGEIFTFDEPNSYLKFLKVSEYSGIGINPMDRINKFKELLSNIDDNVKFICATDPDDEGAAIFANLLEYFGFNPYADNVFNLYTGSVTDEAFQREIKQLTKFSDRKSEVERARARSLFDATYGWNVSNSLHKPMGRLKGAIISLIGENELAKRNHITSYSYAIDVMYGGEKFSNSFSFSSKSDAEEAIEQFKKSGIIVSHEKKVKKTSKKPPALHNEISLTKAVSSEIDEDISVVGNALRLKHHLITYIRTKDTVVTPGTAAALNKNIRNFDYIEHFDLVGEIPTSSIATKPIDHDAIHVTGNLPTGLKLTNDEAIVFDEVLRRVMANMSKPIKFNEHKTILVTDRDVEWFTGYTFTENVITDYGFMKIYPKGGIKAVDESDLKVFNSDLDFAVRVIESKPKERFNEARMKEKLDKIASDIDEPELKALYKDVEGIGTTSTVGPTLLDMKEKGMIDITGKGKVLKITEAGYAMFLHMKKHNVPLIDLRTSAIMEKHLHEVRDGVLTTDKFLDNIIPEVDSICQILLKNPMNGGSRNSGNSNREITYFNANCPQCKAKGVNMAYVNGTSKDNRPYAIAQCESCQEVTFLNLGNKLLTAKQAEKWLNGEVINVKNVTWKSGSKSDFNGKLDIEENKWVFVQDDDAVRKVNGAMIYKGHYIKNEVILKDKGEDVKLKITEAAFKKLVKEQKATISKVDVVAQFSTPKTDKDLIFLNLSIVSNLKE